MVAKFYDNNFLKKN